MSKEYPNRLVPSGVAGPVKAAAICRRMAPALRDMAVTRARLLPRRMNTANRASTQANTARETLAGA